MTADEEVTLLANYGVRGPFDDLLDLPAESKFHSDVSGPSVFLTGALISDEGDVENHHLPREIVDGVSTGRLANDSLRSLLIKHTPVFQKFSSVVLLNRTSELLDKIDNRKVQERVEGYSVIHQDLKNTSSKANDDPVGQKCIETLIQSKKKISAISRKVHFLHDIPSQENTNLFVLNTIADHDDGNVLEIADELLKEADHVLALPKHFDPSSDHLYQRNIRVHELCSKADGVDEVDDYLDRNDLLTEDEDEKEKRAIRCTSHTIIAKIKEHFCKESIPLNVPLMPTCGTSSGHFSSTGKKDSVASEGERNKQERIVSKTLRSAMVEPLFGLEIEPTNKEKEEVAAWDPLIEQAGEKLNYLHNKSKERSEELEMTDPIEIKKRCMRILLEPATAKSSNSSLVWQNREDWMKFDSSSFQDSILNVLECHDQKMEDLPELKIVTDTEHFDPIEKVQSAGRSYISNLRLQPIDEVVDRLLPSCIQEEVHFPDSSSTVKGLEGSTTDAETRILRIQKLPVIGETTLYNSQSPQYHSVEEQALKQGGATKKRMRSLRAAHIRLFLLQREEIEFKMMHAESLRMECVAREYHKKWEELHRHLNKCEEECNRKREYVVQDEISERKILDRRKTDHYSYILKAIEMRERNAKLERAFELEQGFIMEYEKIINDEGISFNSILSKKIEHKKEVMQQIEKRKFREEEEFRSRWKNYKESFLKLKSDAKQANAGIFFLGEISRQGCRERAPVSYIFRNRQLAFLYAEHRRRFDWYKENKSMLEMAERALEEAEVMRTIRGLPSRDTWSKILPKWKANLSQTLEVAAFSENDGSCLNADRLSALLPLVFTAVKANPFVAPHYFRSLSLPLENIASIDYASLGKMVVPSNDLSASQPNSSFAMKRLSQRELHLGDLVREVNLSSNPLQSFSLYSLLQIFPFLEKLELTHNALHSLSSSGPSGLLVSSSPRSVRSAKAAKENAIAERFSVKEVNVSSNSLQDIDVVAKLLSPCIQFLNAHSNQIRSIQPLMTCLKLEKLNLSKNRIESLEELRTIHLLRELDVADNSLRCVDSVFVSNLLLEKLYLSRNSIRRLSSSFAPSLLFLTELFVNECDLESLEYDCFPSLPSLVVLHANCNRIRSISGLRRCPRLSIVQLSTNNIDRVEELDAILFCQSLTCLDVSDNPFLLPLERKEKSVQKGVPFHKGKEANVNYVTPELEHIFYRSFPSLRELNRSPFPSSRYWKYIHALQLPPYQNAGMCTRLEPLRARSYNCIDALGGRPYLLSAVQDAVKTYRTVFATISIAILFGHLHHTVEILAVRERQLVRAALSLEESLQQQVVREKKECLSLPHGLADDVQAQYRRHRQLSVRTTLNHLRTVVQCRDEDDKDDGYRLLQYCTNHPVQFSAYAQKAEAFKQKRARIQIREWIYGRALVHRARVELERRRRVYKASEEYKWVCSAKLIQRVGRGAIVRNRLRNIGQDDLMDNLEERHLEELSIPKGPVVLEDFRSIVGGVLQRMQPEGTLKFEVPDSSVFFCPRKAQQLSLPVDFTRGPFSAPHAKSAGSGSSRVANSSRSEGGASRTKALTLQEQWGTQVANQILKKDEKRSRETKKLHREQYMQNPLKFRKRKNN